MLSTRWGVQVLVALGVASCAGDGCDCVTPIPQGFPSSERVPNAVQLRLSETGLEAVQADPAALVGGLVGDGMGLTFDVPPACGADENPQICCTDTDVPAPDCGPIEIDLEEQPGDAPRLEITPVAGASRLDVVVRARVRTVNDLLIIYDTGIFGKANCTVTLDTTASGAQDLLVTTSIDLVQDPDAGTTKLVVGDVALTQLDNGDVDLGGEFTCDLADLFIGFFLDTLVGEFESTIRETIEEALCKSCSGGDVASCGEFADACEGGTCMKDGACLQELGLSGRMAASYLLSSLSPGQPGALDLYLVSGGYADTNASGVSLGFLGGALGADEAARCGPPATPPAQPAIARSNFFSGNTRPDTGAPFDVAVGVHQQFFDQAAYGAYEGGLLCLNVGSRTVDLLNSETLSVLMPTLTDLMHGQSGQLVLGLRPQAPPVLDLGLGTFTEGGDIDEPLIDVTFPGLEVDFFAMVDDQFIRVMTMRADVNLPINLDVTPDGELLPVLGDVEEAFTNISVTNSEALLETPQELADRLPAVLSLALPFLGDALGSFALPELGGLQITIPAGGITSVEDRTFLAIFGELAVGGGAVAPRVTTTARIAEVALPPTDAFRDPAAHRDRRPYVELELGAIEATAHELEWSVRVDGGLWSPYRTDPRPRIAPPGFWLQGRHTIEVRARRRGEPRSADRGSVVLTPLIDTLPPVVRAMPAGADSAWLTARDNATPRDRIALAVRDGDDWVALDLPAIVPLRGGAVTDLQVRAVDEAGNAHDGPPAIVLGFHGRSEGSGGCDCSVSDGRAAGGAWLLAALCALPLAAPRRRRLRVRLRSAALTVGALALAVLAPGGCNCGSNPAGPDCVDECLPGEVDYGPIGRWSSIAADGDRVVVAAYDEGLGDLVLIEVSGDYELAPRAIDGVPDEAPVFDPASYRGGVVGAGDDVGAWTSVALRDGLAHVAYQDRGLGQLKYIAEDGDGGFRAHVVDSAPRGVVGLYASLAFGPDGAPAIAYLASPVDGQSGEKLGQLRFAQASSPSPSSEADWTVAVLDEVVIPCAGLCETGTACVADTLQCTATDATCPAECGTDEACVAGACVATLPDPATSDMAEGTGLFARLRYLPDGTAVIAYYDRAAGDLVVQHSGAAWTRTAVDAAPETDTGMFASAAVDGGGTVHIAYQDALRDRLLYTTWTPAGAGAVELVDDGAREGDRGHNVGAGTAIALDGNGQPAIVYQDGATADLLVARRSGDGQWTRGDLMSGPELFGFYNGAATGGGQVWVVTHMYDRAVFPPGEPRVTTLP